MRRKLDIFTLLQGFSLVILSWLTIQSILWGWAYLRWRGVFLVVGTILWVTLAVFAKGLRGWNVFTVAATVLTYYFLASEIVFSKLLHKYANLPSWVFLAVYGPIFTLALLEFGGQLMTKVLFEQEGSKEGIPSPTKDENGKNYVPKTFKENDNN